MRDRGNVLQTIGEGKGVSESFWVRRGSKGEGRVRRGQGGVVSSEETL